MSAPYEKLNENQASTPTSAPPAYNEDHRSPMPLPQHSAYNMPPPQPQYPQQGYAPMVQPAPAPCFIQVQSPAAPAPAPAQSSVVVVNNNGLGGGGTIVVERPCCGICVRRFCCIVFVLLVIGIIAGSVSGTSGR